VTELSTNRRTWITCLLLAFVTFAIYWPVRHYAFVEYDDDDYVSNNPVVRAGLSWPNFVWAFDDQHACNWHPLTWLSHMADCQLFGLNPGAFHLENVLFHCANSVLLLLLLNSMMLTLWFYVLHAKKQTGGGNPKFQPNNFYRLSWFCFILGLLAKPMLVTVPIILLLLDFWPLKRFTIYDLRFTFARLLREKIPFFALAIIVGGITLFAQRAGGGWTPAGTHFLPRMAGVVVGYWNYIEKLLWPQNLSFLYLRSGHVSLAEFFLAALVLSGISIFAAANFRRRPWLAVGWLWFLAMLLPVSGVLQIGRLSIADRYTYLPAIGFYLLAVWGIMDLLTVSFSQKICRALATAGTTAILLACAILTRQQLSYWQDTQTLMEHALKVDPNNYVAQVDLRVYLFEKEHPGVREKNQRDKPAD
jgi:protein O-mannosyl-transferase